MKLIFICFFALCCTFASAQDFSAPLPFNEPGDEGPFREEKVEFFEEKQPRDGIIVRIMRTINPLRLFSARAPKEYGDGSDTVSRDPNDPNQKPKGFILFSVNW